MKQLLSLAEQRAALVVTLQSWTSVNNPQRNYKTNSDVSFLVNGLFIIYSGRFNLLDAEKTWADSPSKLLF